MRSICSSWLLLSAEMLYWHLAVSKVLEILAGLEELLWDPVH